MHTLQSAKAYVIRACQLKGLSLMKPTKQAPEILVYDMRNGTKLIADATTWESIKDQLERHYR